MKILLANIWICGTPTGGRLRNTYFNHRVKTFFYCRHSNEVKKCSVSFLTEYSRFTRNGSSALNTGSVTFLVCSQSEADGNDRGGWRRRRGVAHVGVILPLTLREGGRRLHIAHRELALVAVAPRHRRLQDI